MKFRKKPVVIEATQWKKNGDHPLDEVFRPWEDSGEIPTEAREGKIVRYFRRPDVRATERCQKCDCHMQNHGWIDTLEGGHIVCPYDWIITGVVGEYYPCKNDVFLKSLDEVQYSPFDISRPKDAKTFKIDVEYSKEYNPFKETYSRTGINSISSNTLSMRELAQQEKVFDPSTNT